MTPTKTDTDAERAKAEEKAAKDAERATAAAAKEEERKAKEAKRAEEKAAKEKERAEAKAKRDREAIEKILKEAAIDPSTVEVDNLSRADARELAKKKRAEDRAAKPKLPGMTLSQRRALLNLFDAGDSGIVPKTDFNALPLQYLVSVGYAETFEGTRQETTTKTVENEVEIPEAERTEGGPTTKTVKEKVTETNDVPAIGYRVTDAGKARSESTNRKWQTWKADNSGAAGAESTPAEGDTAAADAA